jgi:hypothetical protein
MLTENTKIYILEISRNGLNHWDAQNSQRMKIYKSGVPFSNIKWVSGQSGPNIEPTLTWKVKCSDKQLTMILLKTGAIIEKILDNEYIV